ncbi:hypothetical protein [Halpernia sp. GG3]
MKTEFYEYQLQEAWQMSCASPTKDTEDIAKEKINKMWNKYKKQFKCDSMTWNVPNGNILKLQYCPKHCPMLLKHFCMLTSYGLDINFVLTLLWMIRIFV